VLFTEICHLDNRRENIAPLDKSESCVTHDAHRKLSFSTLAHGTLGIIPLMVGVVTTLLTSVKLIDNTTYIGLKWIWLVFGQYIYIVHFMLTYLDKKKIYLKKMNSRCGWK